ncbi:MULTISPECIES: cupredoxin family copper-binding protein [unclassified Ensifer]|uniref:cupredoxin domain-containing protein n=1 Tax=unclassified Ensifer TaxID=2633371 RepID=UPI000812F3DD|nr:MULTISPECIES: cupredoxin family copper-binding protein [unclassified Ensifer]OCP05741.1 amicyanin [Ensifer sp. LC11]OCP06486.1 amicyanin [Ensifer sp. LC13]OCP06788.1 amicyanin [Ensifer sp. LC14]OCP31275.1 amicyanin [Ensifer sp. LC499]
MVSKRSLCVLCGLTLILAGSPARAETIRVTIEKLVFSPAEISVAVGDVVEWQNNDVMAHTATVKGDFDIAIPPGGTAALTVTKAGTFDYFCRFHPNMKARLQVW